MDKYRVMLVDDEEEVRQAIVRKLDWESLGFTVVGEAANGEEALELCEALAPDVIMTDIKMPFMDGLTLCRRAKQLLPGVKLAIFSGFDEFEYAKQAIQLEVEEYILKPIDADELAGIFRRLRQNLDTEIARARDVARLRAHYAESLPTMRQQLLADLLHGRVDPAAAPARFAQYDLPIDAGCYCAAMVLYEQDSAGEDPDAQRLLGTSLQGILADRLQGKARFHMVPFYDSIALLFLLKSGEEIGQVTSLLNSLFPVAKKLTGAALSIGVGTPCKSLAGIATSYDEARDALEYQPLVEAGQCVFIGDIEPESGALVPDAGLVDEIVRAIKIGTADDVAAAVEGLVSHIKAAHPSRQQFQVMLLAISGELLRLLKAYRLDEHQEDLTGELLAKANQHFSSLEELGTWLESYCEGLRAAIRRERKDTTRTLVERAQGYLAEHYADSELSMDTMCRILGLSAAYFSTIFKKETGEGFVGYLTRLRMEKALEYLNTTDDKTYQIAERVGYTDPNYFSYVFKKHYGISPSKYRSDRMGANETGKATV